MSLPTVVIVPGSYTSSLSYYDLIKHIQRLYPTLPEPLVYDLPSASSGPPLPPPTLYDDGNYFAARISELADTGADIVLFAHSYGGAVAREAVKGFSKEERTTQGKKGGVVRMIYLSAVIPPPGQSLSDVASDLKFDFLEPVQEGSTDYFRHVISIAAARCFNDLPQAEGIKWAARTTIHSGISFATPATELSDYDKAIPSTFISLTKDDILPPDFQRKTIEFLKSQTEADKVQIVEMHTGHCPNASAPEELAKVIGGILNA